MGTAGPQRPDRMPEDMPDKAMPEDMPDKAMSQNCVWNVPRCSGRMERRGFVTGLVPDLWNVMKYKLCININICILYICVIYVYIITSQGYAR